MVAAGVVKLVEFHNIIAGTVQARAWEKLVHGLIGFNFAETQGDDNDVTCRKTDYVDQFGWRLTKDRHFDSTSILVNG